MTWLRWELLSQDTRVVLLWISDHTKLPSIISSYFPPNQYPGYWISYTWEGIFMAVKVKEQLQPWPEQEGRTQGRTIFPWILRKNHRTLEPLLRFTTDLLPIKDPAEQQCLRQYSWSCWRGHTNPAALYNFMCCNSSLSRKECLALFLFQTDTTSPWILVQQTTSNSVYPYRCKSWVTL